MMRQDPALFQRMAWRITERMPVDAEGRVVLVTSAREGEGKSFVAAALAAALKLQHPGGVALVACAQSSSAQTWRESSLPSFSEMTTGSVELTPQEDVTEVNRIAYGSGDSSTAFRASGIALALGLLRTSFSYTILDGPVLANCGALSNGADGGLLVVNAKRTTREVVSGALRSYPFASQKMLGVILNERPYYVPSWLYGRFL